ncbi:DUF692 domain-containing protein [Pseudenhygromyxa sp. WMMC2535]|uniref:DUF692 domain-containing protein n=1 Tax=Pseudenhygromyxa sp. WMMC2535 TaxID=2712867 RepID=UPI0015558BEC|nr:DUF692 domain-containing protein [Pseudenhygromyxa sp. WMMC2535]NVB37288.1 DUF692 domain-containing protein [Pseudenhygromyxa sp. WMMC2535]
MAGRPQGVGIGLRRRHFDELPACARALDFLELIPENFVGAGHIRGGADGRVLRACTERWPMLAHGVSMSLAGPDPLDHGYLRALKGLLDQIGAPFYTDHLCFVSVGGRSSYDLIPPPFCEAAVLHTARRLRELADALERPVAVENISYYAQMPGSTMAHGEFVRAVVEEADCLLLLDVNNVFVNARNHDQDPREVLWSLPTERACQIHLAGHVQEGPRLIDHHGAAVCDEVWALYREALARLGPIPTLIEWDTHVPALDRVLDEADRAREIMAEVCAPTAPRGEERAS